jgi:LPS O-antigen subunit length determinant protein (WzzB/FepE family)
MNTQSHHPQNNPENELTLGDVITFLIKAKWFAIVGMVIGALAAISYLAITPSVYQSKVIIQIQPSGNNNSINLVSVNTDELLERFSFSQTVAQVAQIAKVPKSDENYSRIREVLTSAIVGKGGTFLALTTKANSAGSAEELAQKIADATIVIINQLNAPKIAHLERLLETNKQLIASGNSRVDIVSLHTSNLSLEALLGSPESLKPMIVDGPTLSNSPITPKSKPTLLLGALLGLGLGLLLFYLKKTFFKK